MKKLLCVCIFIFFCCVAFAQAPGKILFVIDSIPIMQDPEEWNQLQPEDIAQVNIVSNKDSLRQLGWEQLDGITYIFTRAYIERPDSIRRIPSLRQMVMQDGAWHFHGAPYTGKYIDYLNSGRIEDEGYLVDGKLNGVLTVYYIDGGKKSVANYVEGVLEGEREEYYKNGALMQSTNFHDGKMEKISGAWFLNGQVMNEAKPKKRTEYDTLVSFYSTGKIRSTVLIKNKTAVRTKKDQDLAYYNTMFYQSVNSGDLKTANKLLFKSWLLDSTSIESHFRQGYLYTKEFRFDDAIDEFDRALTIEPLMREALAHRGLARIKKYQQLKAGPQNRIELKIGVEDLASMAEADREKTCNDLLLADTLDTTDHFIRKLVPQVLLAYCRNHHGERQK
jgi:antitoxin component YwqK of YwqJK toxin-antitoxin module